MAEKHNNEHAHTTIDNLVIQPSEYAYRMAAQREVEKMGMEDYDRIAIERASEKIASSDEVMLGWIKLLKHLHGFTDVHIFEEPNGDPTVKGIRALARPALESALPGLNVHVHKLDKIGREERVPSGTLVISCVDHRFQEGYAAMAEELTGDDRYNLLAVPGASSALDERIVRANIATLQRSGLQKIIIMDHIDCGAFGGLANHGGSERAELKAHHTSQRRAEQQLEKLVPGAEVETLVVGFNDVTEVKTAA